MTAPHSLRLALLACGLLLAAACSAHNDAGDASASTASANAAPAAFTEGNQYVALAPPGGTPQPTGAVVVMEVFSYACPHCAEFAPYMDKLRAALPKGATVRYMPAVFYPEWMPAAQTFYATRQLGVLGRTHDLILKAHREHYPLNSLEDYATFLARHGVDRQTFLAAATNATTSSDMAADQRSEMAWNINETPTLLVGRMSSSAGDATFVPLLRSGRVTSLEEMQQVGVWMAKQVASGH